VITTAAGDQATGDQAAGDQATGDQATGDQATGDLGDRRLSAIRSNPTGKTDRQNRPNTACQSGFVRNGERPLTRV
jgi:hypothetical protein